MASLSHSSGARVELSSTSHRLAQDLQDLARGDVETFRRIHAIARRPLSRTIELIVDSPSIAEEILQEAFTKIWLTADRFVPGKASAWTWMTTIARNTAIDRLRRQRCRIATVSLDSLIEQAASADDESPVPWLESESPSLHDACDLSRQARQLRSEIEKLPAPQQQCLALAYDMGLSHAEVARQLALPLGTVKCWLRRAHSDLRERLAAPVH